ncbi:hypothetical protein [Prevotella sp. P4-119]
MFVGDMKRSIDFYRRPLTQFHESDIVF